MLEQARRLFIERGFADVSMQEIADAAGLRKASLYHHVKDKQALFTEVFLEEMRRQRERLASISAKNGLRSALEEIALSQFRDYESDVVQLARDFRLHISERDHEAVHAELAAMQSELTRVVEQASQQGERLALPSNVAAMMFFHLVSVWTFHAIEQPDTRPSDPVEAARIITSVFLDGALANPS